MIQEPIWRQRLWSLLAWLKWGWIAYTTGGLWKATPPSVPKPGPAPATKP